MKNRNKERGALVIEASLALFFFMLFMLFIWDFAGVFEAQNAASHASLQAVQAIAVENMPKGLQFNATGKKKFNKLEDAEEYAKKLIEIVEKLFEKITGEPVAPRNDNKPTLNDRFEKEFYYFLGGEEFARAMGITVEKIETFEDDPAPGFVRAAVHYKVKLKFNVFGRKEIKFVKNAECRLFGATP